MTNKECGKFSVTSGAEVTIKDSNTIEVHNVQVTKSKSQTVTFHFQSERLIKITSPNLDTLLVYGPEGTASVRNSTAEESDLCARSMQSAFALGAKKWWTDSRYGSVYNNYGVRLNG